MSEGKENYEEEDDTINDAVSYEDEELLLDLDL